MNEALLLSAPSDNYCMELPDFKTNLGFPIVSLRNLACHIRPLLLLGLLNEALLLSAPSDNYCMELPDFKTNLGFPIVSLRNLACHIRPLLLLGLYCLL